MAIKFAQVENKVLFKPNYHVFRRKKSKYKTIFYEINMYISVLNLWIPRLSH